MLHCRLQWCRGATELVLMGRASLSWATWLHAMGEVSLQATAC